jgi:hypothetical protein
MKIFYLLAVIYAANAATLNIQKSLPVFSVSGIITLPYAEINEPFQAWYDESQFASRIDYYGGMVSTIQLQSNSDTDYGVGIKVAPMTTETILNGKTCFWMNGTADAPVEIQSVLPDSSNFTVCSPLINTLPYS